MYKSVLVAPSLLAVLVIAVFMGSSLSVTTLAQGRAQAKSVAENAQPQTVFTNPAPITINDAVADGVPNPATPYPSIITVSGIMGSIPVAPGSIKVTLNGFSHTFPDDVAIVLVGPTGAALLLQSGAGDNPNMVGVTYTLSDTGAAALPNLTAWTAGTYKPTAYYTGDDFPAPGPGTAYAHPGPADANSATFSSVFGGTNPNGDWKLYVTDVVTGDFGNISGGWSLEIIPHTPVNDAPVDINGDGKTDFVTLRNISGGTSGELTWFTLFNGGPPSNNVVWGIATDTPIPADFDGDQKDDYAIWRPGTVGKFYIVRSATNTLFVDDFGQTGDDATVVGDYDGDGFDEMAVYRSGATAGANSFWFYRSETSLQGFVSVQWGLNGDFPAPGDYDGDGRYDFVVQRPDSNGVNGRFFVRMAAGLQYSELFGLMDDVVVPGDYDDDGKTDLAVVRIDGANLRWDFEPSGTAGSTVVTDVWGVAATDYITQGDYDGDGRTDYSVWRPGTPGTFYQMTVGTRAITTRTWGEINDFPAANYNEH